MIEELRRNLIVLRFNSIWAENANFNILTWTLRLICGVSMLVSSLGMIFQAYLEKDDLVTLTYCISLAGVTYPSFAKFYCIIKWDPVLKDIVHNLESGLATKYNIEEKEKKHIAIAEKKIKRNLRIYLMTCLTGCTNTVMIPIWKKVVIVLGLVQDSPVGPIVPTWAPFDVNDYYNYLGVFVLQAYHMYCLTTIWVGLDALIGGMIWHLSAHLNIISDRIDDWVVGQKDKKEKSIQDKKDFKRIVSYHRDVLNLCKSLNESVNLGYFYEIILVGICVCCCGIQVISSPKEDITRALIMLFLLSCILGSWWVVCFFGSEIITESQKVAQSVYFSEWINLSVEDQKHIHFIISRCQRPVYMTSGKFFRISLSTFLDTAKMSYSLLAILREAYTDKPKVLS